MGMAVGSGNGKHAVTPSINVTPLVDVVLVVLIIFMVITPMMTKTFWLNLPQRDEPNAPPPPPTEKKPVVLSVDKSGAIRVNQTPLDKSEISTRVPRMLAASDQKVLYFDAHPEAPYFRAVEAMDLARAGGVKSIAVLTTPLQR